MGTISVIIPTRNNRPVIRATLESVEEAVRQAERAGFPRGQIRPEIVVVDDGSQDGTAGIVAEAAAGKEGLYRLIARPGPSSPSCARNVGASAATGELLFFLDGDDLFLPNHIAVCLRVMEDQSVGFVQTGVALSDPVHADWQSRIGNSLVINLCVRKACHDQIGGFPDYHLFRRSGDQYVHRYDVFRSIEDVYYNRLLRRSCRGVAVAEETVRYIRYPGNAYDRQYEKFQHPAGHHHGPSSAEKDRQVQFAEFLFLNILATDILSS